MTTRRVLFLIASFVLIAAAALPRARVDAAQAPTTLPAQDTPEDLKARETFVRVCTRCHPADRVTAEGRSRSQWEATIVTMQTARGAAVTPEEFDVVLSYLTKHFGRDSIVIPATRGGAPVARGPRAHVGAADRHRVDEAAAGRGEHTYVTECVTCHGTTARGTDRGANLVRSPLVLRDRYGSAIGPLLKRGHPTQSGAPSAGLTDAQITDLSHYIWQRINDTLQGSPAYEVKNVLTGDATAGAAYFNGEGRCTTCHSPAGDLAGYGSRYKPVDIQQRFVFPAAAAGRGSRRPLSLTITTPDGATVTGDLITLDDFQVAVREASGQYRSFRRQPGMQIVKHDPYAAHVDLLDRLTDKAMHDVVAYLETLK
ncbi:MAG: c-type cytochrome [Acidobacteria bacterium]|nr:c-type cytochrome [Acidobacteriota bacterium]